MSGETATSRLYHPYRCEIIAVSDLTSQEKLFRLRRSDGTPLGHQPGQFIQLSLFGFGEAPISLASSPTREGWFELGVRRAGSLTGELHGLKAGASVGVRGPFGTPFNLTELRGRNLLLISGGCGLAPLRSLIQYCEDRTKEFGAVTILYGAKNPEARLFKDDLAGWEASARFACGMTVDSTGGDGCFGGTIGLITSLIPPLSVDPATTTAVIVGPPVMYRPVIAELKKKGLTSRQIIVSLERQMRCGVGKCGHCTIEHLYCCQDGPVFRLDQVEHLRGAI